MIRYSTTLLASCMRKDIVTKEIYKKKGNMRKINLFENNDKPTTKT